MEFPPRSPVYQQLANFASGLEYGGFELRPTQPLRPAAAHRSTDTALTVTRNSVLSAQKLSTDEANDVDTAYPSHLAGAAVDSQDSEDFRCHTRTLRGLSPYGSRPAESIKTDLRETMCKLLAEGHRLPANQRRDLLNTAVDTLFDWYQSPVHQPIISTHSSISSEMSKILHPHHPSWPGHSGARLAPPELDSVDPVQKLNTLAKDFVQSVYGTLFAHLQKPESVNARSAISQPIAPKSAISLPSDLDPCPGNNTRAAIASSFTALRSGQSETAYSAMPQQLTPPFQLVTPTSPSIGHRTVPTLLPTTTNSKSLASAPQRPLSPAASDPPSNAPGYQEPSPSSLPVLSTGGFQTTADFGESFSVLDGVAIAVWGTGTYPQSIAAQYPANPTIPGRMSDRPLEYMNRDTHALLLRRDLYAWMMDSPLKGYVMWKDLPAVLLLHGCKIVGFSRLLPLPGTAVHPYQTQSVQVWILARNIWERRTRIVSLTSEEQTHADPPLLEYENNGPLLRASHFRQLLPACLLDEPATLKEFDLSAPSPDWRAVYSKKPIPRNHRKCKDRQGNTSMPQPSTVPTLSAFSTNHAPLSATSIPLRLPLPQRSSLSPVDPPATLSLQARINEDPSANHVPPSDDIPTRRPSSIEFSSDSHAAAIPCHDQPGLSSRTDLVGNAYALQPGHSPSTLTIRPQCTPLQTPLDDLVPPSPCSSPCSPMAPSTELLDSSTSPGNRASIDIRATTSAPVTAKSTQISQQTAGNSRKRPAPLPHADRSAAPKPNKRSKSSGSSFHTSPPTFLVKCEPEADKALE